MLLTSNSRSKYRIEDISIGHVAPPKCLRKGGRKKLQEKPNDVVVAESVDRAGQRTWWYTAFLLIASIGLALEVALLVWKNRELEQQLQRALVALRAEEITPGTVFEPFTLVDETGWETLLEFGAGQPKTLLLVFSSDCSACLSTFPIWAEIIPAESSPKLRVVGVSMDETGIAEAPSTPESLPFAVFTVKGLYETSLRNVIRVPVTIMLESTGEVKEVWTGFLVPEKAESLRGAIDVARSLDP